MGLDAVHHLEPTSFDAFTLGHSIGHLSDSFLKNCGYGVEGIRNLRIQYGPYQTCFLSYARDDAQLAVRLFDDLRQHGVSCWRDESHARAGSQWRREIANELRDRHKILFICTKISTQRRYVREEIIETLRLQKEQGKMKLIPVDGDGYLLNSELRMLSQIKTATGEWDMDWVPMVLEHQVADFRDWQDETIYNAALSRLLCDLKQVD